MSEEPMKPLEGAGPEAAPEEALPTRAVEGEEALPPLEDAAPRRAAEGAEAPSEAAEGLPEAAPLEAEASEALPEAEESLPEAEAAEAEAAEVPEAAEAAAAPEAARAAGSTPPPAEPPAKKKLPVAYWAVPAVLLLVAALVAGFLLFGKGVGDKAAKPIAEGRVVKIPDNLDGGLSNEDRLKYEREDDAVVPDETAPEYEDPTDLSHYREVSDDGKVYFKAPLDGKCAMSTKGGILPPKNYLHVCYYEQGGAIFYTSHAVIGKRTGALENIQYLTPGQIVWLDNVKYKVKEVSVFEADKLPPYLFKPGVIGLVTCHIDSSVKTFEDFTKTDVVTLEKV